MNPGPAAAEASTAPAWLARCVILWPGLALSVTLAVVARLIRETTGIAALNPVVIALMLGIALNASVTLPRSIGAGVAFAVRPVLRVSIVLLGLQVTLGQLLSIGAGALATATVVVAATIPFTMWLGRRLGVSPALSQLIGAGTGICGASAVVAANQVARGSDEEVAYALAVVTLFGTVALIFYPILAGMLSLDGRTFGLWAGASIHEVVQAVGAAAAGGPEATETGTITKLARVVLLAPAILALAAWARRNGPEESLNAPMPWFAFGFVGLVLLGSTGVIPRSVVEESRMLVPLMMSSAVAALGLGTRVGDLRERGLKPLLLGGASTLFIAVVGLVGAMLVAGVR